jgi:hypothetical protein
MHGAVGRIAAAAVIALGLANVVAAVSASNVVPYTRADDQTTSPPPPQGGFAVVECGPTPAPGFLVKEVATAEEESSQECIPVFGGPYSPQGGDVPACPGSCEDPAVQPFKGKVRT